MLRSGLRRLARWGLIAVVLPAVILLGLEGLFRLNGVGHTRSPFITRTVQGAPWAIRNPAFTGQFFSWQEDLDQSLWGSDLLTLSVEKPAGAYRIFVFGGSAAQGWPDAEAAFSRLLEAMLYARFPGVRFEVYNLAYMGMNSHVMREIARKAARFSPDLFLVYMGNNEFYGPFGPVSGAVATTRLSPAPLLHARIRLSNLRLLQACSSRSSRQREALSADAFSTGLLRPDHPVCEKVYSRFEANLKAICGYAEAAEAQILLGTVGANLFWPPSETPPAEELTQAALRQWESALASGLQA